MAHTKMVFTPEMSMLMQSIGRRHKLTELDMRRVLRSDAFENALAQYAKGGSTITANRAVLDLSGTSLDSVGPDDNHSWHHPGPRAWNFEMRESLQAVSLESAMDLAAVSNTLDLEEFARLGESFGKGNRYIFPNRTMAEKLTYFQLLDPFISWNGKSVKSNLYFLGSGRCYSVGDGTYIPQMIWEQGKGVWVLQAIKFTNLRSSDLVMIMKAA